MGEHADDSQNGQVTEPVGETEVGDAGTEADASSTDLAKDLLLAGIGVLALTREKAEAIMDDLVKRGSERGGDDPADQDSPPVRGTARLTDRAASAMSGLFREVGLVTEPTIEDLELRVAQLEHRLRILERKAAEAATPGAPPETRP